MPNEHRSRLTPNGRQLRKKNDAWQKRIDALSVVCLENPGLTVTSLCGVVPRVLERCEVCRMRALSRELDGRPPSSSALRWSTWRVTMSDGVAHDMHACDRHVFALIDLVLLFERVSSFNARQLDLFETDTETAARKAVH